jgi:hypothetical protein
MNPLKIDKIRDLTPPVVLIEYFNTSTDLIEEYWSTQINEDVLFLTQFSSTKTTGSTFHYPFI